MFKDKKKFEDYIGSKYRVKNDVRSRLLGILLYSFSRHRVEYVLTRVNFPENYYIIHKY